MKSLKMNPFSFKGRNGSLNFLVYGIVTPVILGSIGFLLNNPITMVGGIVIAIIMLLATAVRRGRDAGHTPASTIITYLLSSWVITGVMDATYITLRIMLSVDNKILGVVMVAIIQNIYLVYLFFAEKSEKEIPESSKFAKISLILFGVIIVIGILAAVVIPKLSL